MFVRTILFCFVLAWLLPDTGFAQDGAAIKQQYVENAQERAARVNDMVVHAEAFTIYAKKDSAGVLRHRIEEHGSGFPIGDLYWTLLSLDWEEENGEEDEDTADAEKVEYRGTAAGDDRPLHVFELVTDPDTTDNLAGGTMYVDTDSLLLRRMGIHVAHQDTLLTNVIVALVDDYRSIDGITLPYALEFQMHDIKVFIETEEDEAMLAQMNRMIAYLESLPEAEREQQLAAIPAEVQFIFKVVKDGSASLFYTIDSIQLNQGLDDALFEEAAGTDG